MPQFALSFPIRMKGRIFYFYWICLLCLVGFSPSTFGQTITISSLTPASVCAGGTVSVSYVTSGTFTASNTFSVQLTYAVGRVTGSEIISSPVSATRGTITATTPTTVVSGASYSVRVISSSPSVASSATPITINKVDAPSTSSPVTYCLGQPASSLSATPTTGATLNWYGTNSSGGTGSGVSPVPSTTATGSNTYYVSQTLSGCEGPRAGLVVTVNSVPASPGVTSLTYCEGISANLLTATPSAGGTLKWYGTAATGGTASGTAPAPSTTPPGPTNYYVSQTVNGCESNRVALTVTVKDAPNAPGTSSLTYCAGQPAGLLTATPASASATLNWYGINQTGGTASSTASTPSTNNPGTINYYVSQTQNGCESPRAFIAVTTKTTPGAPGTSPLIACQNRTGYTLTAMQTTGASLNWYGTAATGGTATATSPTLSTTTVGTTVYYVSQTLNSCEGPRASLSVRVKATPGAPGTNPISFCNGSQTQQLSANGTNLKWYDSSDNLIGSNAPSPNSSTVGNQVYKVTQTSGEGCESPKASITVIINPLPGTPTVADLSYCQSQPDQPNQNVSALNANGQNLKWYLNNVLLPFAPTPFITQSGTQVYQVSQTVNNCEGSKADIRVNINTSSAPTTSKSLITYCVNDNATPLAASGDNGGRLFWVDPYNRTTNDAPTPSTINTNVTPGGDLFYVYQIGSNGCYSPRTTIRVIVTSPPTLALAAPTASVNLGQRAPLQLKFTSVGPYSYTITGGYTGTSRTADTTISVLPRANTIYQIIGVSNGCGVGLPGNPATAQIMVRVPTVSTGSLSSTTLCTGTSLSANFTTTGEFNTGNTFRLELVNATDTTKKYSIPATANASPVTVTLPNAIVGGQYYVRVKADNPEIAITGSNSPTPLIVRSVASATLTGAQTIYEGVPANLTLTFAGDGPWTATYADSLRTYPVMATTSPYLAEVRPTRTTTYRLVSLSNSCGSGPVSGTATITVSPLLGVDDNPLDPLVKTYPVPTTTTLRVELNLPLAREPATLSLTDQNGRPVLQKTTRSQQNELDLSAQPGGMYFLRIQVGDKQTVRKVVKE